MKKLVIILAILLPLGLMGSSPDSTCKYGVELSQLGNQSGFGTSTHLKLFVQDTKNKNLSVGVFYDSKLKKIGGFSVSLNIMLLKDRRYQEAVLKPYIVYNFVYHRTNYRETVVTDNYIIKEGVYKSLEHYIGFGFRTMLTDKIYTNTEVGYGMYLGSIMKPSTPDPVLNESMGTNGTGGLAKIAVGMYF